MSQKIDTRARRSSSCDFDDIEEAEDGEVCTPVNQSNAKIDVESITKRSQDTQEKLKHK